MADILGSIRERFGDNLYIVDCSEIYDYVKEYLVPDCLEGYIVSTENARIFLERKMRKQQFIDLPIDMQFSDFDSFSYHCVPIVNGHVIDYYLNVILPVDQYKAILSNRVGREVVILLDSNEHSVFVSPQWVLI